MSVGIRFAPDEIVTGHEDTPGSRPRREVRLTG
jgi:hypothetical protein